MGDGRSRGDARKVAAVVGAGAWGTTLAALQAENFDRVWLFTQEVDAAEEMLRFGSNSRYVDDARLPRNVLVRTRLAGTITEASTVIVAVPSGASREVAREVLAPDTKCRIVLATKGLEAGTGLLSLEVWRQEIAAAAARGRRRRHDPLVLSGPNLALEISRGMPAVSTLAGSDAHEVRAARRALEHERLCLVASDDPVGAQAAGALKNVYAVGCGMASALGWGDNAMAAIVWRGLSETARFAQALGGDLSVVGTPAGVGDFLATCTSPLSRNHDLGRMLSGAEGNESVRGVREGAQTAAAALRRARALGLSVPLLESIGDVLSRVRKPEAVLAAACGASGRERGQRGAEPAAVSSQLLGHLGVGAME
jgi:glycerol-3-phosphate dehydrogenase (NAD(P)+)